ncbi:MAG TPA: nitronate monooxygenase [Cytophagaceae bacterium]|jgi:enoyl-[acyl-carrier protein] reductase II
MNSITSLFNIKYPIVQAGMVWCSGWKLASAVSNAGGLGLIGSGSMRPEVLKEHIIKCKAATRLPFGVNVPLLYPDIDQHIEIIIEQNVPIVFTSAGNPNAWTAKLKEAGITVAHVVSSVKFALKAQEAGVDAVVAEGFEAGGHNGREETTTFCLIPMVKDAINIPLIAAGGIANGRGLLAALALGADGVQIGSRFAVSAESSAHENYKKKVLNSKEGETALTLKDLNPVRLIKNEFYDLVKKAEANGATKEELQALLGKGRAKRGIFEGDLEHGEIEIGQISAMLEKVESAEDIIRSIWQEYLSLKSDLCN